MPNLDAALGMIRERSSTAVFQGHSFERLVKAALLDHPGEFRDRFSDVWLWEEYPDRDGPDIGVDLVARDLDGKEWAIQCKDYPRSRVATRSRTCACHQANSYLDDQPRNHLPCPTLLALCCLCSAWTIPERSRSIGGSG